MHLGYLHLRLGSWIRWTLDIHITRQIYATHKKVWLENLKSGELMVKDDFLDLRHIHYYVRCSQMDILYHNKNDLLNVKI